MRTILITIDTLRRDHLSCYGYHRKTTPFLEELAEENSIFRNCYATSPHIRESIPSILTGNRPENCIDDSYRINSRTMTEDSTDLNQIIHWKTTFWPDRLNTLGEYLLTGLSRLLRPR